MLEFWGHTVVPRTSKAASVTVVPSMVLVRCEPTVRLAVDLVAVTPECPQLFGAFGRIWRELIDNCPRLSFIALPVYRSWQSITLAAASQQYISVR